jgi:hypothetical protein
MNSVSDLILGAFMIAFFGGWVLKLVCFQLAGLVYRRLEMRR